MARQCSRIDEAVLIKKDLRKLDEPPEARLNLSRKRAGDFQSSKPIVVSSQNIQLESANVREQGI